MFRLLPILTLLSLLGACAPPKVETTFLRSVDLVDMTEKMAQSFAAAPALQGRRFDTPPRWIISIDKVVNDTNQLITENEKWAYVGRLRALLTQTQLSENRNLAWIVPPERWPIIQSELRAVGEPPELRMAPTHLMTARFAALTNTSAAGRADLYLCGYQLVDLVNGTIAWEDSWEVKRAVKGRTYD